MPPLYKRYVPPKPSAAQTFAAHEPALCIDLPVITNDAPIKRKRERTEEEVAERKAKKLKKKGIDSATVEPVSRHVPASGPNKQAVVEQPSPPTTHEPQSEFAHIKNSKKRHKLEKEARKARKAASKENGELEEQDHTQIQSTVAPAELGAAVPKSQSGDYTAGSSRERRRRARELGNGLSVDEAETEGNNNAGEASEPRKKRRKDKNLDASEPVEAISNEAEHQKPLSNGDNAAISQPKKRRHKLEGILQNGQNESSDQPGDPDDHLRKHAGIMSKFSQSQKLSEMAPKQPANEEVPKIAPPVMLDLAPLPQPAKAPTPEFIPDPSSVPKWLAEPTIIPTVGGCRFEALNLEPNTVQHLSGLGFEKALPVQQALIPLLLTPGTAGARFLPGTEPALPDLAVGAPTGSGKTIAYLLPMIESIRKTIGLGRLKALVVVPTRELVVQVAAVADSLGRGSGVKVGMATGTGSFKDEQTKLTRQGRQYDPPGYRELLEKAHWRNYPPNENSEDFEEYLNEIENEDPREVKRIQQALSTLIDHVPTYESAVDILVATPGRLLEHLDNTLGFSLAHLEWFILDEADKLIDQQYDGFLQAVNNELSYSRPEKQRDARERYLRARGSWNEDRERRVRKVVLSATMTRDISKLVELKLKRPQLMLVQSERTSGLPEGVPTAKIKGQDAVDEFELPPTLLEYCVPVGDGSEKPLHFIELLEKRIVSSARNSRKVKDHNAVTDGGSESEPSDLSDSDSDSDSDSSSVLSTSSEETSSSESSSEAEDDGIRSAEAQQANGTDYPDKDTNAEMAVHPDRAALLDHFSVRQTLTSAAPVVLVFVSSTESTTRLAHLLEILKPDWAPFIRTMTRTDSQKALSNLAVNRPSIIISTDRAARGLDNIASRSITHVIQYDVPRSATGYIHRVGRTARAGRRGEAWTLYTHSEARWFYKGICKSESIKRAEAVEKVKLVLEDDGRRDDLANAVAVMRDEVYSHGRGKPS